MASRLMNMIEERTKPHTSESFGKVSSHWKLIRDSVQKGTENPKQFDKQQSRNVGHGVHPVRSIDTTDEGIETVAYNSYSGNYVGISPEGKITMYLPSGYKERMVKYLHQPIHGLVYAAKTRQYVGWGHDENIKLISESFKVISATSSISRIHCGVFNETTNEVITGGVGNITCWSFRYGAKFLLQRKVFTDHLSSTCVIGHLCLEDTPSRAQRCFAAYGNNVIVYTLLDGTCVAHYKDIHSGEITSVMYFNPLKFLVTASKDGSIKVWDDKGNVKIIFIGHLKSVNTLVVYPFGPYIMSGSSDGTIRVWSLDTADEVDRIHSRQPVKGLGSTVGRDNLFSFGSNALDLWKIEHVHSVFTTVGCKVKTIKTTTHPRVPTRMVCICSDATVRLISPGSGACITTLLVPGMQTVADVVCAAAENLIFTLLSNGTIVKASTLSNPCKIVDEWKKESTKVPSTCTCLCLYEYVVEDKLENDNWGGLVSNLKAKQMSVEAESPSVPMTSSYDRTLLLGGCVDGTIVVYDWMNRKTPGVISFQIQAHREEVVTMVANPSVDQVLSAGLDNCIKVWRLFPFAQEALAPVMTLYCQETPRHLSVAHHRLCVALHEPSTASYNVVVFKTTQKERFDHNSDDDHTDDITGVASCPKMRIFASCSMDGSIRIWDEANHLLRVITLNALPTSLCFCSQKGDLLVGIGNHLHKIEYATYMPRSYIYRMVAMEFQRATAEKPLTIDDDVRSTMSSVDQQRLTRAKSSLFKFTHYADLLSPEEMNEKVEEEERRTQAFSKIQERENELKKLRDGVFEFQKRKPRPNSELVRRNGFQKYLEIFYKRPDVEIPEEDDLFREQVCENEDDEKFARDRQPTGFFGIDMNSLQRKTEPEKPVKQEIMCLSMPEFQPQVRPPSPPRDEDEDDVTRDHVLSREGFTPGDLEMEDTEAQDTKPTSRASTAPTHRRLMEIGPPLIGQDRDRYIVDVPKTERYPSSTRCRHMIAQKVTRMANRSMIGDDAFVIAPDGFIPNSVVVSLFKDLKSKEVKDESKIWKPPTLTDAQLAELQKRKKKHVKTPDEEPVVAKKKAPTKSNFADQLMLAMRDIPSPEPVPEVDIARSPTPTPPPTPPPKEPTPPPSPPRPSPQREVKPKKPIEKFISRPKPPTPPPPTPPRDPTPPPPPPTPLPEFITQFMGTLWFEKFFPDAQPDTFPKPWTVGSFIDELLRILPKCTDFELKTQVLAAIMLLNRQDPLDRECSERVSRTLIAELNTPDPPTAHASSVAKQFLKIDMQLLQTMKIYNISLVAELMAQYIDGDEEVRQFVQEMFVTIGVHDPGNFFPQELDSFDTQDLPGTRRKARVREMCLKWIDKWLSQFKQHIRSLAGKITRAQAGSVVKGTKTPKTPSSIKGILKKEDNTDAPTRSAVKFDMETLGSVAAESASPVEAVNYFCEMRMQEELEKAKARARVKTPPQAKDNTRNTVLILPKIHSKRSLARLGETHCSHCHPERETSLSLAFPLPPIYAHRKDNPLANVSLRLKTLTLNPFPEEADIHLYEAARHAQLLTLRSAQKYFFPSQSYVQGETMES